MLRFKRLPRRDLELQLLPSKTLPYNSLRRFPDGWLGIVAILIVTLDYICDGFEFQIFQLVRMLSPPRWTLEVSPNSLPL